MANLNPMLTGKVVGQFVAGVIDGPDIGLGPDYPSTTGHVKFTMMPNKLLVHDGVPNPATVFRTTFDAVLDEDGYISHNGSRGVELPVPSPGTTPQEFTWKVEFDVYYLGERMPAEAFYITVPEYIPGPDPEDPDTGSSGLVDLTEVTPTEPSPGVTDTSNFMRNYGGVKGSKRVTESQYAALELAGQVDPEVMYVGFPG